MKKDLEKLWNLTKEFADFARSVSETKEDLNKYLDPIIWEMTNLYEKGVTMYLPILASGAMALYQENNDFYIPLCFEEDDTAPGYGEISVKEVFDFVADNLHYFGHFFDPKYYTGGDVDPDEAAEYCRSHMRLAGVMTGPEKENIFGFEGWMVDAVVFKGNGGDSFHLIDADTGETFHEYGEYIS